MYYYAAHARYDVQCFAFDVVDVHEMLVHSNRLKTVELPGKQYNTTIYYNIKCIICQSEELFVSWN